MYSRLGVLAQQAVFGSPFKLGVLPYALSYLVRTPLGPSARAGRNTLLIRPYSILGTYLFFYVNCIYIPLIGGLVVWELVFQADYNVLWVWFSLWFLPCCAIAPVQYKDKKIEKR